MPEGSLNHRYQWQRWLGRGTEGEVALALDLQVGRPVALKVLRAVDGVGAAALRHEYAALSAAAHPALAQVFALARVEAVSGAFSSLALGAPFLVEEWIDGPSLAAWGGAPVAHEGAALARLGARLADALAVLHAAGARHGDLAPQNLLCPAPVSSLADWAARAVLIDLGLSQRVGGTPGYAAPEVFFGEALPASDLYSLGALLYRLAVGAPPAPGVVVPEIGSLPGLAPLLGRLLCAAPEGRPAHAAEVRDAFLRLLGGDIATPAPAPARVARPPLVGRRALLARLQREGLRRVVCLHGEAGIGKGRLARAYLAWLSLETEGALRRVEGEIQRVSRLLGLPDQSGQHEPSAARSAALLAGAVVRDLVHGPLAVHIEESEAGLGVALAQAMQALAPPGAPPWVIVLESREPPPAETPALVLALDPLSLAEQTALVRAVGGDPARVLLSGNPGRLLAHLAGDERPLAPRVGVLSQAARRLLAVLALLGEGGDELASLAGFSSAEEVAPAWGELVAGAWLSVEEGKARLSGASFDALALALPEALREVAPAVAATAVPPLARARALASLGDARAVAYYEDAARAALASLDARAAVDAAGQALALSSTAARGLLALYAECLSRAGRLDDARRAAVQALASPGEEPADAALWATLAGLAARQGDHEETLRTAARGQEARPAPAAAALLRAYEARALLALGRLPEARAAVGQEAPPVSYGGARLWEARGLLALRLGERASARAHFEEARRAFLACQEPAGEARALSSLGMVLQADGALPAAADAFREALAKGQEGADLHAAATYAANLGAALHGMGDLAGAEESFVRALHLFHAIGRAGERCGALYNYANLCLALGEVELARERAAEALSLAESQGDTAMAGYCRIVLGEAGAARGEGPAALALFSRAAEDLAQADPRGELYAWLGLLRAALPASTEQAREALQRLRALAPSADAAELAEAEGRWWLEGPLPDAGRAAARLGEAAARYAARPEPEAQWRALAARARALALLDPAASTAVRVEALAIMSGLAARVPAARRTRLWSDPERAALLGEVPARRDSRTLARLLSIAKRFNTEQDRGRLLSFILDAVIELTRAERGFLLVREGDERELRVVAARQMSGVDVAPSAASRSIAERAARQGEPLLTVDAEADPRFVEARSVVGLRLRAVLAAPLVSLGRVLGCVYVDAPRRGAFSAEDASLIQELGELAAVALEGTRLRDENLARQAEIERLNAELAAKVQAQAEELTEVRAALARTDAELRSKYNYSNIVGRSPKMRALFQLLDRVTDASVPVLIYGESGTGKELAAKAVHYNGPRAERPFVSENCAAIPEGLLESALFGHVRGAFTGADRERKGLFELAHGGTLFLDEIGETSPRMQARLLRVIQEREVRRVGAEKAIPVNVRLVCATNRDLWALAQEGKFREDLYFRLAVVKVELPPLRERVEDIPQLVEHFLARLAPERGVSIDRRALARMVAYAWPGNVRELENEVHRAALLSDGVIEERHLSPGVRGAGREEPKTRALLPKAGPLKEQVEALEREQLRRALAEAKGNRSRVAAQLGLSRFGLQKKLRRYGMDD